MPEKNIYSKPELNKGQTLDFITFGDGEPQRIRRAVTKEGQKIYRKETGGVHTIEEEKSILQTLHAAGVSVEIPFQGGDNQTMYTLDEGDSIIDALDSRTSKQRKEAFEQLAHELAKIHNAGILHGDMHEKNIVYSEDEKITIIDFELGHFIEPRNNFPFLTDEQYKDWYASKLADEVISLITSFEDLGKIHTNEKSILINSYLTHIHLKDKKVETMLKDKLHSAKYKNKIL